MVLLEVGLELVDTLRQLLRIAYAYLSLPENSCETRRLRKEILMREAEPFLVLPPEFNSQPEDKPPVTSLSSVLL